MHIAVYENNLLWSVKLRNAAIHLGHTCVIMHEPELPVVKPNLCIINLSVEKFLTPEFVAEMRTAGCTIVGHAGHADRPLMARGREAKIDHLVTNGALANDLPSVLALVPSDS